MPLALSFAVILVAVVALLVFNKTLRDSRIAELEITSRTEQAANRSLTESQLVELIRSAVREETEAVVARLDELEEQVARLTPTATRAGIRESDEPTDEANDTRKTLGRSGPIRTS